MNAVALGAASLAAQVIIFGIVLTAAYIAKIKKRLISHCRIIRIAVAFQALIILTVMLPLMRGLLKSPVPAIRTEILVHHTLGLLLILLWGYINLVIMGKARVIGDLKWYMRTAFTIWSAAFVLGIHLFYKLYLS